MYRYLTLSKSVAYYQCGLLLINQDDVEQTIPWANKHQIPIFENYKGYPAGMSIPANALFLPEIAQVRVPGLLKALHASLLKLEVNIFEAHFSIFGSLLNLCFHGLCFNTSFSGKIFHSWKNVSRMKVCGSSPRKKIQTILFRKILFFKFS